MWAVAEAARSCGPGAYFSGHVAEILRCVSRRVRSEANARENASAHFAQDDRFLLSGLCGDGRAQNLTRRRDRADLGRSRLRPYTEESMMKGLGVPGDAGQVAFAVVPLGAGEDAGRYFDQAWS